MNENKNNPLTPLLADLEGSSGRRHFGPSHPRGQTGGRGRYQGTLMHQKWTNAPSPPTLMFCPAHAGCCPGGIGIPHESPQGADTLLQPAIALHRGLKRQAGPGGERPDQHATCLSPSPGEQGAASSLTAHRRRSASCFPYIGRANRRAVSAPGIARGATAANARADAAEAGGRAPRAGATP